MKNTINLINNMIMRFRAALFLVLILAGNYAVGQTLAYYKTRKIDTSVSITESKESPRVPFYFPRFDEFSPLTDAYTVTKPGFLRLTRTNGATSSSETIIFTRLFTKNIAKVRLSVPGDTCTEAIEITYARDGYQVPGMDPIGCMVTALNELSSLYISYTLKDSTRPFTLLIGDLRIGDYKIEKFLSPSNLFVQFPFDNAKMQKVFTSSPFDSYGECAYFPSDQKEEDFKGSIFIEDSSKTSSQLLSELLIPLVKDYPFYKERSINKQAFIQKTKVFIEKNKVLSLCVYVDSLNAFISRNLMDAHFYIKSPCHNKKVEKTPVYTYPINARHLVAGVFDDSLKASIPVGSELVEIDGKHLNDAVYESRDVNTMLKKLPGEKVSISLKFPDGHTEEVSYSIKEKYKIPSVFSPGNLELKFFGDTAAYYKINKINAELPLDFVSRFDSINTKNKLILDFRNNGGGDFLAGAQFLSYLINRRFNYFDYEDIHSNNVDSVVVKANSSPYRYREDGKIILLIDESTACIAELVVYTLKAQRSNVIIVGRGPSRGALSFIYEINLPKDNIVIATNCLDTGRFLLGGKSIEGKGIFPNVKVAINSVYDLQPYRDKVLTTALSK